MFMWRRVDVSPRRRSARLRERRRAEQYRRRMEERFFMHERMFMEERMMMMEDDWDWPLAPPPPPPPPPPPDLPLPPPPPRFPILGGSNGVERVKLPQYSDPTGLFIRRVTACVGWAVHGIVFELIDGTREGVILMGNGIDEAQSLDDARIAKRQGVGWTSVEYGDYIVAIHGHHLTNTRLTFLCHTLTLEFASGRRITYEANHEPWRGEPFSRQVSQPNLVFRVAFGRSGQSQDMRAMLTAVHLPIAQAKFKYLPVKYQRIVQELMKITDKIDSKRVSLQLKPLSNDLWGYIMEYVRVWEVLDKACLLCK